MQKTFLYNFISAHKYAVLSTVTTAGLPEAALVGFAATPDLRIIFDTVNSSRKYLNLIAHPAIAFVIGWNNEQTLQYEGTVFIPTTLELDVLLAAYFNVFPEGRERWKKEKDLVYFCVQPTWTRYADFNHPQKIEEMEWE